MMVEDASFGSFNNKSVCEHGAKRWGVGMQIDIEIDATDGKKWFFHPQVVFGNGAVVQQALFNTDGTEKAATDVVAVKEKVEVYDGKVAGALDFNVTISAKTVIHI